jgi:hypothetical protein
VAKKAWLVYNISPAATTQMRISKKNAKLTASLHAGKALSECRISNKEHRSSKFAIQHSIFVRGLGGPAAWHGFCTALN